MREVDVIYDENLSTKKEERVQMSPEHPVVVHAGEEVFWRFHVIPKQSADSVRIAFKESSATFFRDHGPRSTNTCEIKLNGQANRTGVAPQVRSARRDKYTVTFLKNGETVGEKDPEIITDEPR